MRSSWIQRLRRFWISCQHFRRGLLSKLPPPRPETRSMKLGICIIALQLPLLLNAQNILTGYTSGQAIIAGDTLTSHFEGIVMDSLNPNVVVGARVEFFSTRGDALAVVTDSSGFFHFDQLPADCKIRVLCLPSEEYQKAEWLFSTEGLQEPIQLRTVLRLKRK